jgi:hypothetical protein
MLAESQEFVTVLISWMNAFLTDRANKGDDETETIQHLSHALRTIMEMLHGARAPGRGPFVGREMGPKLFWGTLQAIGVMRKFRETNFSAHPALSHILHLHLQDNAVTKSEMKAALKKIKDLTADVKILKGAADREVTTKNAKRGGAAQPGGT